MAKKSSILVYKRADGKWVSQRKGETQVSGVYSSREEALHAADKLIQLRGNGEIIISSHHWSRTGPSIKKRGETITIAHQKRKRKRTSNKVRVRFQNGHFIPLEPLDGIDEGAELAINYELPGNEKEHWMKLSKKRRECGPTLRE